uniref:DNA helicase n=1 Tax=Tanacetum cinerariifolium TaxID=118510 RepID=A0A6L2MTX5_TANCI|nr:DNA helicase [Tanacetum cinerariifolium]
MWILVNMFVRSPFLFIYGEGHRSNMKLITVSSTFSGKDKRVDYICQTQNDITIKYLSGLYDAILKFGYDGSNVGMGTIFVASFTGGP